ncbi:TPA: type 2 lanthipeptide synthetase LanM family protein [Bacillus cereus]
MQKERNKVFSNFIKGIYIHERQISPQYDSKNYNIKNIEDYWNESLYFDLNHLKDRIEQKNIPYEAFLGILHCRDTPSSKVELEWVTTLLEILDNYNRDSIDYDLKDIGIFVLPFTEYFGKKVSQFILRLENGIINSNSIVKQLQNSLFIHLKDICSKSIVWDFHRRKKADGKDKEDYISYYINSFLKNKDYQQEFLQELPVLARALVEITSQAIVNTTEIFKHYSDDYWEIKNIFFPNDKNISLEYIHFGLGDSHKNGKSVSILEFNNEKKVVYKPRSLNIDNSFSKFVNWINSQGLKHSIKVPRNVIGFDYGWQEFIENQECTTKEDIEKYYYRIGTYIAIFYILETTDMHYENIISAGEHPFIIDLETLFSNRILDKNNRVYPLEELASSVLGSGLLPHSKIFTSRMDLDLSGISGGANQESKTLTGWALCDEDNDNIHFEKTKFVTPEFSHLVKFKGNNINPFHYLKFIEQGFEDCYNILLRNKKHLIELVTNLFTECECRIVLRPTYIYDRFLTGSYHPKYLSNGIDREKLFEMLWNIVKVEPNYKKLVEYEIQDLLNHDIPYFTFKVGETSIFNSNRIEIPNMLEHSSLQIVRKNIKRLNNSDMEKQVSYIRLSLEAKEIESLSTHTVEKLGSFQSTNKLFEKLNSLEIAKKIGDNLLKSAVYGEENNYATWIGIDNDELNNQFTLKILDLNFYNGILGNALFLAELSKVTGEPKYKECAEKVITYVLESFESADERLLNITISMYSGVGSIIYPLYYLALLWEDEQLLKSAKKYLNLLKKMIDNDKNEIDFLNGYAGVITFCSNLYELTKDEDSLEIIKRCGENLAKKLLNNREELTSNKMLTGLAHGSAGIALALSHLKLLDKNFKYTSLLNDVLSYEDSNFDNYSLNWLDLRNNVEEKTKSYYWCHGAPGILLARSKIKSNHISLKSKVDLKKVLRNIIENKIFPEGICLCHGIFGNIDILTSISKLDPTLISQDELRELANYYLSNPKVYSMYEGMGDRGLTGIMLGLSGVGYALLRLTEPEIPSILTLELPQSTVK